MSIALNMPVLKSGHTFSLRIFVIFVTFLQQWGVSVGESASTAATSAGLPPPTLRVESRSSDQVTLVCQAPQSHQGVLFNLFRVEDQVDSFAAPQGSAKASFRLRAETVATDQQLYCCLYKNSQGVYSAFSPYLSLTPPPPAPGAAASPSPATPPSPVLSVAPPSGHVRRGQMLSFQCSLPVTQPTPQPHPQGQSKRSQTPLTFVLVKKALVTGDTSVVLQPQATRQTPNTTAQLRAFSVGPVKGGDGGSYACMYQLSKRRRLYNSTFSNVIQVTVTDQLPRPTLALLLQGGVWLLSCKGSAAYPGARFYLFQADSRLPVATHQASATSHQAAFSLPVRDQPTVQYECRYSALLGDHRSESEPSVPLETGLGIPPTPALGAFSVDWPLVAGSFSAVVLFIIAVALFVYMVQRKVRGFADEKKKRKEAEFWSKSQAKDHMADPEPRHSASTSHESASGTADTAPRSSVWNPLSTFSSPSIH
ncbi:uncharacterized protein LOC115540643 isoform X2 [Gadus morhua]|uniref:uncharacterized protein LOC115540643 isoform X2 n=1 Tax=Gadus morhua TaxID=8049 RepID=UPI0011B44C66|nr:uncharacterized protein LOC115540643 isoform X2 [Gadus morhua]